MFVDDPISRMISDKLNIGITFRPCECVDVFLDYLFARMISDKLHIGMAFQPCGYVDGSSIANGRVPCTHKLRTPSITATPSPSTGIRNERKQGSVCDGAETITKRLTARIGSGLNPAKR